MPKSVGKFTIGAFSVTVDGKTAQSAPLAVEVVPAGAAPPQSPQPAGRTNAPGAFVKLSVSRSKVHLNEEVILKFKFYYSWILCVFYSNFSHDFCYFLQIY